MPPRGKPAPVGLTIFETPIFETPPHIHNAAGNSLDAGRGRGPRSWRTSSAFRKWGASRPALEHGDIAILSVHGRPRPFARRAAQVASIRTSRGHRGARR